MQLTLYTSLGSGNAYKVELFLRLLRLPYETRAVNLRQNEHLSAAFLARNRFGQIPVLVDGDTGYGEALNVMHMVRAFEDAGAGAVHIEDQRLPKKCGHLNDKTLVDAREMAAKVAAAAKARRHLYLIARTDAADSEGLDGAVARARLYMEAGADAIFPEALTSAEMFRTFAERMPGVPLLANMTEFGRTPMMTAGQFESLGYRMVLWPVSSLRVANKAQARLYETLRRDGSTQARLSDMQTRKELYDLLDLARYEALDRSIVRSVLPDPLSGRSANERAACYPPAQ